MKITTILIGVAISIIMVSSVLMPVIVEAQDNEKTVYNNQDNGRYSVLYDSDLSNLDATIVTSAPGSGSLSVTVGDDSYNYPMSGGRYSMIMCDKLFIRIQSESLEIHTTTGVARQTDITFPLTVSIVDGVVTVSDAGSYSVTVTPEKWVFIPDTEGKYETVFRTDGSFYLNDLNQVYYTTYITSSNLGLVTGIGNTAEYVATGEPIDIRFIDVETIEPYTDLIRVNLGDCQLNSDVATNSDGTPIVPNMYMVPISVDAHTPENNSITGLLSAVPVLLLVAIVASMAVLFRLRD